MHYGRADYIPLIMYTAIIVGVFYLWAMRRRRALMEAFADKSLLSGITPSFSSRRKIIKTILVATGLILAMVALARPQWGFEWEEVKRSGLDILVALDVSKSMLARDMKPNRLERSKLAIKDMIKKLNGDRVGLIAFAGTAFLQCPLTIDYNGFLLALDDVSTDTIPRGGTSIAAAINEAMTTLKGADKKYKILVIITDGEELEGDALAAARDAAREGIRIYSVGVGTAEGEVISVVNDYGERSYVTDRQGNTVKSRLNESLLKEIALATGGGYIRATQSEFGLLTLYDKSISKLEKHDIESKMRKRYEERYQIFLAIGAVLLFIEPFIAERRRRVR